MSKVDWRRVKKRKSFVIGESAKKYYIKVGRNWRGVVAPHSTHHISRGNIRLLAPITALNFLILFFVYDAWFLFSDVHYYFSAY